MKLIVVSYKNDYTSKNEFLNDIEVYSKNTLEKITNIKAINAKRDSINNRILIDFKIEQNEEDFLCFENDIKHKKKRLFKNKQFKLINI